MSAVNHPQINIPNHAGYFTVNKEHNSNLFFWFFPAKIDPDNAPVVLWLQGGPGASSLFGLFTENGPYSITPDQQLVERKFSWNVNHNLIYIDNPVGTGFSFTDADEGYAKNEVDVGRDLLEGLQQFFQVFPHLQSNEFFVSGESYAGKYVPAVGHAILQDSRRTTDTGKPKINLKGLAIGNGLSDPVHQMNYGDYLYQLGLIDSNGHDVFIKYQAQGIDCIQKKDFDCAFKVFDELINMDQLPEGSLFKNMTGYSMYFNYLKTSDDDATPLGDFLQKTETRRAIHVGNNSFHDLEGENKVEEHLKLDVMDSVAEWVSELLSNYPVLIYNGQLDIIVAYPMTENYLKNLAFSGAEEYKTAKRYIWRVENDIAGYAKHAGNLTEVLVRNAGECGMRLIIADTLLVLCSIRKLNQYCIYILGHMAPGDQPKWVLDMLLRFTHHKGFKTHQ